MTDADFFFDQGLVEEAAEIYRALGEECRKLPGAEKVVKHALARLESIGEEMLPEPVLGPEMEEKDPQTIFAEATALLGGGELILALERYEEALAAGYEPRDDCLEQMAEILQALGRYSEAVELCRKLAGASGLETREKTRREELLARVLHAAGKGEEALALLKRIVAEGRASSEALKRLEEVEAEVRRQRLNLARL